MANPIKNTFNYEAFLIFSVVFALGLFASQRAQAQVQAQYTGEYAQQQPTGTATPQQYQQSYQQPAQQNYQQPAPPPAQPGYQQSGYNASFLDNEEPPAKKGKSDHDQAVGKFGLAFLGIMSMPILENEVVGVDANGNDVSMPRLSDDAQLMAPTLGLRYWLNQTFGLEAGVGMGMDEGSLETLTPDATVETDMPSNMAFTFHVGVPIALLYSGHFVFEAVPMVNLGLSSGTISRAPELGGDWDLSTLLLQAGVRLGAEIHFGFIGVEQLALQASLGFQFSYLSASAETQGYAENSSKMSLGTTTGSKPWDIFTENLSAIYYIY